MEGGIEGWFGNPSLLLKPDPLDVWGGWHLHITMCSLLPPSILDPVVSPFTKII